jgi:hypothetical protein
MMYYPWPALTETARVSLLEAFQPSPSLIGFAAAESAAVSRRSQGASVLQGTTEFPVGGRLKSVGGRLVYHVWWEVGGQMARSVLVDALSGQTVSPIREEMAAAIAREVVGDRPSVRHIDHLAQGDYYMMNRDYAAEFPAYRVQFDDPSATAVYVGELTGSPFGVVTTRTRLTTWFGTMPHWLYFHWLYDRPSLWEGVNIVLPSVAVLLALTGIALGLSQLLPRRRRGDWRLSPYQGISRWHHIAGVTFGVMVLTWTSSAILQMVGGTYAPPNGQAAGARGGPVKWGSIRVSEAEAARRIQEWAHGSVVPVAIDLLQFDGRPGYHLLLANLPGIWVDAESGLTRSEMTAEDARAAARRILGDTVPISSVERVGGPDTYYYARPGREVHLPAWRIMFADANRSVLYLDTINGSPVGFVDASVRRLRWFRDALHSFDYPLLNNRRPLWDLVVLPVLLGGALIALTGAVLLIRRVRRIAELSRN